MSYPRSAKALCPSTHPLPARSGATSRSSPGAFYVSPNPRESQRRPITAGVYIDYPRPPRPLGPEASTSHPFRHRALLRFSPPAVCLHSTRSYTGPFKSMHSLPEVSSTLVGR